MPYPYRMMPIRARALTAFPALLLTCVLALGATQVQALEFLGKKVVTGSGQAASVKRELSPFHQISISLPGTVELVQGSSENIVIDADDNLLPLIETVVKSGELNIRAIKGVSLAHGGKIRITLNARSIEALSVAGSCELASARLQSPAFKGEIAGGGSITVQDLQSDNVAVSIAGSGRFEVRGAAKAMDISIAGSGDVVAPRFSVQDVNISIAGSGKTTVWARNSLSISITGTGDVYYYGETTAKEKSIDGSRRIKKLGTAPPD